MKTKYIFTLIFFLWGITNVLGTSYTWNGSVSTNYANNNNWTPSGIPDSADNVTISTGTYNLALDQNRKVTNLTLTSKTINLSTYTLTVYGTATMNSGTVTNGTFRCRGTLASFKGTLMDCPVDAVCGYIQLSGSTFNDVADFTDQGTASGTGTGGCTFNGNVTITHNGTLTYFTLANTTGDTFNANVTFTNNSNREINVATSGNTSFNGNIIVNSTSTGGILFANSGGTSTLASGKTISVGSSGFAADYLTLKNFTQTGSTAQTLTLTSTAIVNMISSTFNGNLTITAPGFLLKNNTFNGTVTLTRNASSGNHQSDGNNVFNNFFSLDNFGSSGRIRFATTSGDIFNANATFSSSGSQDVQIAYSGNTIFEGNLTINSNKVVFNTASGKVTFSGGNAQTLNGSYNYPFKKLAINKSANNVTANTTLSVDDSLLFILGKLITTSTNLLTMKAGSVASGASNSSFVSGPVKKVGNSEFKFPIGKSSTYSPIIISAPTNITDAFTSEYNDIPQTYGSAIDVSLLGISDCDYWTLNRTTGSSNVYVSCGWTNGVCHSLDTIDARIASYSGGSWNNAGNSLRWVDGNNFIKSSSTQSNFTAFALAYIEGGNSCQSSHLLYDNICNDYEYNTENLENWFSFSSDSLAIKVKVYSLNADSLHPYITSAELYQGDCHNKRMIAHNYTTIPLDSLVFFADAIDTSFSKQFLLKITKSIDCSECINDTLDFKFCIENSSQRIHPFISYENICGLHYNVGSVQLNQRISPVASPAQGSTLPANIAITAPGSGSQILGAFLYGTCVSDSPPNVSSVVFSDGVNSTDPQFTLIDQVGAGGAGGTCWSSINSHFSNTYSYRADVTFLVNNTTTSYSIGGLPVSNTCDWDGVSLIIIYKDCAGTIRKGSLYLSDGL